MNNQTKRRLIVVVGILSSALFLWFAFRNLHPLTVLENIRTADPLWLLAGTVTFALSVVTIAWRWQFLLQAVAHVSLARLTSLVCIGYMGNNIYPFRSGEALRIYLLRRGDGVPIVKGTTTVVVERVFDGVVMLSFVIIPLLFIDLASEEVRAVVAIAAPLFLALTVLFFALSARPDLLRRFAGLIPGKPGDIVTGITDDIAAGLEGLRSPAHLAGAVISSYITWGIQGIVYGMVALAFGLDVNYGLMLLVVGVVNLAGLIPASPGQIGVFEFFASAALVSAGIPEADALAYALVVHLVIWLPVTVIGFALLIRQGLGLDAVARARELEKQSTADVKL